MADFNADIKLKVLVENLNKAVGQVENAVKKIEDKGKSSSTQSLPRGLPDKSMQLRQASNDLELSSKALALVVRVQASSAWSMPSVSYEA